MAQHDRSARFAPGRSSLFDDITLQIIGELEQGRVPGANSIFRAVEPKARRLEAVAGRSQSCG